MKWIITPLIVIAAIAFAYSVGKRSGSKGESEIVTDTVSIYVSDNVTHAHIQSDPVAKQELKEAITKEFYSYTVDTLAPALKIAQKEIDRLTRINAKLKGKLSLRKRDTIAGIPISRFEGRYMTIDVIDTTARYSYNATLDFVDYHKSNWLFGKDKYYTDISSPDSSFRIFNVQTYRRPFLPVKDRIAISAAVGMSIGRKGSLKTGMKVRFNPDGVFSPYAGAGREFFFGDKPGYYLDGGVEFNFYRK